MSVNRVTLAGNVGNAEFKVSEKGGGILKFSLATNKKWKNDAGEMVEDVQWHRLTVFGKRAESLQQYVVKGTKLLVEGELRYGKYEKDGETKYTTDIIVSDLHFLGGGKRDSSESTDTAASTSVGDESIPF